MGVIKESFQSILKQGCVKGKVVHRGEGVLNVSPSLPPLNILIIHMRKFEVYNFFSF